MATILVIDDAFHEVRDALDSVLREYEVVGATDGRAALTALRNNPAIDVVLLDVRMPPELGRRREEEGLAVFEHIRQLRPELPVIFLSTYDDLGTINKALTAGGFWYLKKPPDYDETRLVIQRALVESQKRRDTAAQRQASDARARAASAAQPVAPVDGGTLLGDSAVMRRLVVELDTFASTDLPVLLLGESGTGKELCAREVHERSPRCDGPFIAVNCNELNHPETATARMFGHAKGAFTGADEEREGLFEMAQGGTLFFDEIGDLDLELQGRLLRAMQEREIVRMGAGEKARRVDVRLVFATDKSIDSLLEKGKLSEPFYYRINVGSVRVPPLRERIDDLEILVPALLERAARTEGVPQCRVEETVYPSLRQRTWRGNVRELDNVLRRAATLSGDGGVVKIEHLQLDGAARPAPEGYVEVAGRQLFDQLVADKGYEGGVKRFRNAHGEKILREVLTRAGKRAGNWAGAGELLGFIKKENRERDYEALRWWLKELGLRKEHLTSGS